LDPVVPKRNKNDDEPECLRHAGCIRCYC
jgi:hypothetical protein